MAAVQINLTHCSVHLQCGNEPGTTHGKGTKYLAVIWFDLITNKLKCQNFYDILWEDERIRERIWEDGREMPPKTKEIAETVCAAFEAGAEGVVNSSLT